jgi:3-phenylpropionate/trans-cinnamate dioxygenase ferredoxin subunit
MPTALKRVVLGPVEKFPPGTKEQVQVEGRAIAVFNVDGRFYALRDVCPHQGAPLSRGAIVGNLSATEPGRYVYDAEQKRVRCPWHGWEYDLVTGQSSFDPRRNRVRSFPVSIEDGSTVLAAAEAGASGRQPGPHVAETVRISVEDEYLVIDV